MTNRPYTLFHDQAVHEHGAVGIALSGTRERPQGGVEYPGLEPLGPVEVIAQYVVSPFPFSLFFMLRDPCRAQGNLLLRLEPSSAVAGLTNPTQALIRAINAFRAASPSLPRPAEAASAARAISIGKGMKEEEYYLALYDQDGSEVRFWRVRGG